MINTSHDEMPPRPECEFDFNLPHGTDAEEEGGAIGQGTAAGLSKDRPTRVDSREDDNLDALLLDDPDNVQQQMNYDALPKGFSDDEGEKGVLDRSWGGHQARKLSPKSKKSPKRFNNGDASDAESSRTKRPRQSLFGGPVEEAHEQDIENNLNDQDLDMDASEASREVRRRLHSLSLDQQDEQRTEVFQNAQDNTPFDLGLGLESLEQDGMLASTSRAPSEDSFILPPDDQPIYELRQNIDRAKAFTYIDTDKTGDYDPSHEARLKALKLQKAKSMKAAKKKSKGKGKEKGKPKVEKEHVSKLIVRLHFSFRAFGDVRNRTDDEDNWREGWSDVDTDHEEEAKENQGWYRHNTPGVDIQMPIDDPQGSMDDLTGHPSARGCKQCRIESKDCTMVEGGSCPCDKCEDEDVACEPIIEPMTKGRCKQCDHDGEDNCSLEKNPEQSICEHCMDGEFVCEALAPLKYKTPRISIDKILYGPNRKHVQCTFCRANKKRCSLKKKTDKPPCKSCKNNSIGCTFYDIPKAVTERQAAVAKKAALHPTKGEAPKISTPGSEFFSPEDLEDMMRDEDAPLSREATPEIEMVDSDGNEGMITKIKTCFAHPVQFNVPLTKPGDCNFCEMPMFGSVGQFEREVYVIKWHSGLGYTEVGGGHREDKDPTRMCMHCTMARVQIILCDCHTYERMSDDTNTLDFAALVDDLSYAEPGSDKMRYELQRWCSMCFSPATIGCATSQRTLIGGEGDEEHAGCGLRLCDKCHTSLQEVYDWDLEVMAAEMDNMPKACEEDDDSEALEAKPRADVGYLRKEGLLMLCVAEGFGAGDETGDEAGDEA